MKSTVQARRPTAAQDQQACPPITAPALQGVSQRHPHWHQARRPFQHTYKTALSPESPYRAAGGHPGQGRRWHSRGAPARSCSLAAWRLVRPRMCKGPSASTIARTRSQEGAPDQVRAHAASSDEAWHIRPNSPKASLAHLCIAKKHTHCHTASTGAAWAGPGMRLCRTGAQPNSVAYSQPPSSVLLYTCCNMHDMRRRSRPRLCASVAWAPVTNSLHAPWCCAVH